ncbi:hypothetical protein [Asaia sp. VD9]|uniref:hypothetical protein n=1 Tax=Asaia sp. VD9 TaxID=3081235 RepID=UPI003019C91F
MASVTQDSLDNAIKGIKNLYRTEFRGKPRGRFILTRWQLMTSLGTRRLHASTIARLQDEALAAGLVIIDLDDLFPVVEVKIVRKYRRPPNELFSTIFPSPEDSYDLLDEDGD